MKYIFTKVALTTTLLLSSLTTSAQACTRIIYEGSDNRQITTRSMDWETNLETSLWIFPAKMQRDGGIDSKSIKWTSKYGSIVAVGFNAVTADGMNEKGLVANLLWLGEADYGESNKPTISIGAFTQYVLDNYANVEDAVNGLNKKTFQIIAPSIPGEDEESKMHLTISDPTGDSAIIEFINGQMVVLHSKEYKVATNSPTYEQQLSINSYWEDVGGNAMLPGTHRPADRFARASFYTNNTLNTKSFSSERMAVATAVSIIREASVPLGVKIPQEGPLPFTLWRTIADQKSLKYYFDSAVSASIYWVDINKLDLKEGASVKTLDLKGYPNYSGEVSNEFIDSKPFKWLH